MKYEKPKSSCLDRCRCYSAFAGRKKAAPTQIEGMTFGTPNAYEADE